MAAPLEILLIGGSGFMGRHVARAMLAAGHGVTVLSRGRRNPVARAATIAADRREPASLAGALEQRRFDLTVDFLVYGAADIECLRRLPWAALGRYVMVSTGQVYLVTEGAKAPFKEEDADGPLVAEPTAGTQDHANWSYGVGKRRAEEALRSLCASQGVSGLALRLPIVQGEGDGSLRLWAYLERMLDGGPLVLPDGGRRPTRFLYAADLARALLQIVESPALPGSAYNLAQPDVVPLREFLGRVAKVAGLEVRFVDAPWRDCHAAGLDAGFSPYAGRWASVLDPARAAGECGFVGTRLDDYLPQVVRWHLEQRRAQSHAGYTQRARELALAAQLTGEAR